MESLFLGTEMNSLEKEVEYAKHRMEVLRMARQLLNEEYINRRAEDHNRWLAESDVAWRTKGIKLPYPPFAPYPTEAQILAKARDLIGFVVKEEDVDKVLPAEPPPPPQEPTPMITVPEPEVPHAPPQESPRPETGTLGMTSVTEPANPVIEAKPEPKRKGFWFGGQ